MSADTNVVVVAGRLTRDPESRTVGDSSVTNMRLAVNGWRKAGDGYEDVPAFFNVSVWGKSGENCARYLTKGSQALVTGRLTWKESEKDGVHYEWISITADRVQFTGAKGDTQTPPAVTSEVRLGDEDIPF